MKKKGFMLIEVIVYIFVVIMVLLELTNMLLPSLKEYRKYNKSIENYKYLLDAETYINSRLSESKIKSIEIEDNSIKINMDNYMEQVDTIKKKDSRLVIDYKKNNGINTTNVILRNLEEFNVYEKNNLIYMVIKQNGEEERIFCYGKK